tara:strand:+ start:224 stop:1009 length:786 start_codon:yes stop_codon:yes gene_type:complete
MFGTYFYHEKIRKCVSIFGRLFNNLYVLRKNSAGSVISQVKVPLSYAPKQKYLERIRENPDLSEDTQVAIKLPRMSFEITNFSYDLARQLTKVNTFNTLGSSTGSRQKFFPPVPWTISFQLNVYAKNQDDALQVVEQILPFFNPQYTLTIKPFLVEYPEFKEDIPIIISGVSFQDDFEGSLESRRTIVYAMDFEMKVSFHGPINTTNIVRQVDAALHQLGAGLNDSSIGLETIRVNIKDSAGVFGMPDSDFGFVTTIIDSA